MKASRQNIESLILAAASKIMADLPKKDRKELSASSDLYGGASPFDSMNLVSFIVDLEERIKAGFGKTVSLADERAMSQKQNPFNKVKSLAQYVESLLDAP